MPFGKFVNRTKLSEHWHMEFPEPIKFRNYLLVSISITAECLSCCEPNDSWMFESRFFGYPLTVKGEPDKRSGGERVTLRYAEDWVASKVLEHLGRRHHAEAFMERFVDGLTHYIRDHDNITPEQKEELKATIIAAEIRDNEEVFQLGESK